jgi:hypothetical protein
MTPDRVAEARNLEPTITHVWVSRCPSCEWESGEEPSEQEASDAFAYHLKWIVHEDD